MDDRSGGRAAIVWAVRACVGTPFRPQGRTVGIGLDCVGVVLCAAEAAAVRTGVLPHYRLGGDHDECLRQTLDRLGCVEEKRPLAGDIVVVAPRPRLRHLGILTPKGLVHAHAGLGRVVEGPVCADWQVVGHWRLPGVI